MQFSYGAPYNPVAERPRCWSKEYSEGVRECRICSYQVSCKDEIIRANVARQPAPAQQQPQYFQPYAVPQPVQVMNNHVPQQSSVPTFRGFQNPQTQLAPMQHQPQQIVNRNIYQQPTNQFGYGWIQDPLYFTLTSAPPPMRPQMGDETFFDRVVKNTGLAMLESFFGQCLIAVRQMVLPPMPKSVEQPSQIEPPRP